MITRHIYNVPVTLAVPKSEFLGSMHHLNIFFFQSSMDLESGILESSSQGTLCHILCVNQVVLYQWTKPLNHLNSM